MQNQLPPASNNQGQNFKEEQAWNLSEYLGIVRRHAFELGQRANRLAELEQELLEAEVYQKEHLAVAKARFNISQSLKNIT